MTQNNQSIRAQDRIRKDSYLTLLVVVSRFWGSLVLMGIIGIQKPAKGNLTLHSGFWLLLALVGQCEVAREITMAV